MNKKKALFVYNPKSGKAAMRSKLSYVLERLEECGYLTTVRPTTKRGDAIEYIKERDRDYDLVICSGGDGTLDEVVTGMEASGFSTTIGYLPTGSTNDFGQSLGLTNNILAGTETIISGKDFSCDIGKFNDDVFVYIAAFGLFTEVSYETSQDFKNVLGHMAYLLEGMKKLTSITSYPMKITTADGVIEDEFVFGMVTNSLSIGGFKRITGKNVVLDDGVFEVTLIKRPRNPIELSQIMASLINQELDTECMYCFKASSLTIECKEPVAWTLDGEYGGCPEKVEIMNLQKAATIRVNP